MIYVPISENTVHIGGPSTFLKNLAKYFNKKNICLAKNYNECKVIFFPISYNINVLKRLQRKGVKIVQRLDGIYYPSKHGKSYIKLNKEIQYIYKNLSDKIIFQSKYSRKQCELMWGASRTGENEVILNGADRTIFFPNDSVGIINKKRIEFITTGNFRNNDMLEPILLAMDNYKKTNFRLTVVGPLNEILKNEVEKRSYVRWIPKAEMNEIALLLRESDVFLYSHLNPPCPNSVIEAASSGLPVVGFNSGAMEELLSYNVDLLAYVSDDVFQEYDDFKHKELLKKIELCVENFSIYKRRAMENAQKYDFNKCGDAYLDVLVGLGAHHINIIKVSTVYRILLWSFKKILQLISRYASKGEFVRFLLSLENVLYELISWASIMVNNGVHPKHRLTNYHQFFLSSINNKDRILDIGCGKGFLAGDIAMNFPQVKIVGIDLDAKNIEIAKKRFVSRNLQFRVGDATTELPEDKFNVLILSNVLEHINDRIGLLKKLKVMYKPDKFIIRVPSYERDWRVPFKNEVGVDYRLDPTHYLEYTDEVFQEEINSAGLEILTISHKWGEIWSVVK